MLLHVSTGKARHKMTIVITTMNNTEIFPFFFGKMRFQKDLKEESQPFGMLIVCGIFFSR